MLKVIEKHPTELIVEPLELISAHPDGAMYHFTRPNKKHALVLVGKNYPFFKIDGQSFVLKNYTSCAACTLGEFHPTDPDCPGDDLYTLFKQAYRNNCVKNMGTDWKWLWILGAIILVVIIIAIIFFVTRQKPPEQEQALLMLWNLL